MIDVVKALGVTEGLKPLARVGNAWESHVVTPATEFRGLVFLTSDGDHLFFLGAADSYDPKIGRAILRFARKHEAELIDPRPLAIVDGFNDRFDAIASVSADVHRHWTVTNPAITRKSVRLYPIYRSELAGDEDAETLRYLIPRTLHLGFWNRKPPRRARKSR